MPQHKSAEKALRQSEKRKFRNKAFKTSVKTEIKRFLAYLEAKDFEKSEAQLRVCQSLLHRGASKGIFHWKKAANKISKLFEKLNKAKAQVQAQ